jgi:hypothetical protein
MFESGERMDDLSQMFLKLAALKWLFGLKKKEEKEAFEVAGWSHINSDIDP